MQFSSIHHNPLFCNSRGKRTTFFNLIQIHSDLLFYNIFMKRIKMRNCPFTAGLQISQGKKNFPLKTTLPAPNCGASVRITVARSQAKDSPRPQTPAPPGRFHPQQNNLEHSQGSHPQPRTVRHLITPPSWLSCYSVPGTGSLRSQWQPVYAPVTGKGAGTQGPKVTWSNIRPSSRTSINLRDAQLA